LWFIITAFKYSVYLPSLLFSNKTPLFPSRHTNAHLVGCVNTVCGIRHHKRMGNVN